MISALSTVVLGLLALALVSAGLCAVVSARSAVRLARWLRERSEWLAARLEAHGEALHYASGVYRSMWRAAQPRSSPAPEIVLP